MLVKCLERDKWAAYMVEQVKEVEWFCTGRALHTE